MIPGKNGIRNCFVGAYSIRPYIDYKGILQMYNLNLRAYSIYPYNDYKGILQMYNLNVGAYCIRPLFKSKSIFFENPLNIPGTLWEHLGITGKPGVIEE
jgi:hypothetical protein